MQVVYMGSCNHWPTNTSRYRCVEPNYPQKVDTSYLFYCSSGHQRLHHCSNTILALPFHFITALIRARHDIKHYRTHLSTCLSTTTKCTTQEQEIRIAPFVYWQNHNAIIMSGNITCQFFFFHCFIISLRTHLNTFQDRVSSSQSPSLSFQGLGS